MSILTPLSRVVVNFANYGLQFFTGEGTFYVEMTFGVSGPDVMYQKCD